MKNIACAFIIFITLSLSYKINAQDKLLSNYDQLSNLQVEKVFLHIDRDILSPGDVLWYKAYLLNDLTYTPATESLNLHIELISNEGKVAANNVSLLQNGLAQGYLKLNDSIPAGNYTLRAYTHQMRNLDDLLFFTQQITILETGSAKQIQNQEPKENMIDLQFMPEGGSLVENVTSKVAFKATDLNGEPYNFQGELYNNKNQLISMVSTMHDGMGFFQLKPIPGESYHVKITSPAIQQKYTLPDALEDGVVVSTNTMSNETIDVYLSANPADFSTKRIKFVLHTRGNVAGMNNIIMNQPVKRLRLPKAQIPAGISCITIMTMTNVPLAERLLYNHRNNDLIVSIKSDKKQYYPREKVNLEIETKDKDGNPVQANLSLSVTDQIGLSKEYQDFPDIYSYFFLNSNFRGTVKNPSYYFKNQDMTKRMHLDLVLMTNGWRNFIWKEVANKDLKLKYKYEKGLDIKGKVIHISKKDVNNKVTLASFDEGFFYQETTTDSLGNFCFRNLLLNDTTNVIIEAFDADNNKLNKIELTQEDYVPAPFKTPNNEKFELTRPESYTKIATEISEYKDQIKTKNHIFLDEVIVRETKHQTVYKPKDNNQRISIIKPSNIIDFDDVLLESTQSIVEVVMARVPGIQKRNGTIYIRGGTEGIQTRPIPPLFFMDGIPIDYYTFENIPKYIVQKIEVSKGINQTNIYGEQGRGGVINIFTRKTIKPDKNDNTYGKQTFRPRGFLRIRQFYSPNYDNKDEQIAYKDLRVTIFWEPNIVTDSLGKAHISFFTADREANYLNLLQGVGDLGKLGSESLEIEVKENK